MGEHETRATQRAKTTTTAGPSDSDRFGAGLVGTNMTARILKADVVNDRTLLTIAKGKSHGVQEDMHGYVTVGSSGEMLCELRIESVRDNACTAYVEVTSDQLQNHLQVVINPPTMPGRPIAKDTPIQRRASGASPTADVQSTAQAGVASASSRLPFFDTIQRSFGRHDISNVQSQTGGTASVASETLGARAYATGDKVAFASSPDLHTAAHEAAHTIQQRHGSVRFQGLGEADDEYERHADAVADAVVAGQSAEPLLDQVVGGSATTAIQRKASDPPIHGVARLSALRTVLGRARTVLSTDSDPLHIVFEAKRCLIEARHLVDESGIDLDRDQRAIMRADIEHVGRSVTAFRDRVQGVHHLKTQLRDLVEADQRLRATVGLDTSPVGSDSPIDAIPAADGDASAALLDLVAAEASRAHRRLAANEDRHRVLAEVAPVLRRQLIFVHGALPPDQAARESLNASIESTSREVLKLRRWVSGREASSTLMASLDPVLDAIDSVRSAVRLGSVLELDSPTVSQKTFEEERDEQVALGIAHAQFIAAMDASQQLFKLGVERFETFVALKRPAQGDKFGALLVQAALTVALNVLAPGVGTFASAFVASGLLGKGTADLLTKQVMKGLEGEVKRTVQRIAGGRIAAADSNDAIRERRLFAEAVLVAETRTVTALKAVTAQWVNEDRITARELVGMAGGASIAGAAMSDLAYVEAAHGFALLQARMNLSAVDESDAQQSGTKSKTTDADYDPMSRYLDKNLYGSHRKEGTHGVGKLELVVTQDGDDLKLAFTKFHVHGLNDDMAIAVLQHGGYVLDQLGLPLEIEMRPPRWGYHRPTSVPFMVIDEKGQLREAAYWSTIQQALTSKFFKAPRDVDTIATPQALWATIRGVKLPPHVAKISKGG